MSRFRLLFFAVAVLAVSDVWAVTAISVSSSTKKASRSSRIYSFGWCASEDPDRAIACAQDHCAFNGGTNCSVGKLICTTTDKDYNPWAALAVNFTSGQYGFTCGRSIEQSAEMAALDDCGEDCVSFATWWDSIYQRPPLTTEQQQTTLERQRNREAAQSEALLALGDEGKVRSPSPISLAIEAYSYSTYEDGTSTATTTMVTNAAPEPATSRTMYVKRSCLDTWKRWAGLCCQPEETEAKCGDDCVAVDWRAVLDRMPKDSPASPAC